MAIEVFAEKTLPHRIDRDRGQNVSRGNAKSQSQIDRGKELDRDSQNDHNLFRL